MKNSYPFFVFRKTPFGRNAERREAPADTGAVLPVICQSIFDRSAFLREFSS